MRRKWKRSQPFDMRERHLYDGAQINVLESYILMLQFALKHTLTKKVFEELLLLIIAHLPKEAKIPKSIYKLKQYFVALLPKVKITTHQYCKVCHELLSDSKANCAGNCHPRKVGEFVYVPVGPQIERKLQGITIVCILNNLRCDVTIYKHVHRGKVCFHHLSKISCHTLKIPVYTKAENKHVKGFW